MKLITWIYKGSRIALYILKNRAASVPKYTFCRYTQLLLGFISLFALSACSDAVNPQLEDYAKRLERLAGEQRLAAEQLVTPIQPSVAELRRNLPRMSLSLLDSFRLNECRLGQVVAERNSSLGKVMTPANQLYYEIKVTRALKECLTAPVELSPALRLELTQALAIKESSLALAVHNFLTTDQVWRANFRFARHSLPMSSADDFTSTFTALSYFAHTLTLVLADPHQVQLDLTLWHEQLEALNHSRFLSAYWRTFASVPAELERLTELLERTTKHIGCSDIARPQQAQYLHNVMLNIYIAKLQPAFARWAHYQQQLAPVLKQLVALTEGELWLNYVQQLGYGHTNTLQQSSRNHAEQWQLLLAKCRLTTTGGSLTDE